MGPLYLSQNTEFLFGICLNELGQRCGGTKGRVWGTGAVFATTKMRTVSIFFFFCTITNYRMLDSVSLVSDSICDIHEQDLKVQAGDRKVSGLGPSELRVLIADDAVLLDFCWQIGAVSAVMQMLYHTVVGKGDLSRNARLSIRFSIGLSQPPSGQAHRTSFKLKGAS